MIRPFSRSAVLVAAGLLVSSAQAQPTPQRPAQPQAGAAAPGTSADPSPAQLALARELTNTVGILGFIDPMMPQFGDQIRRRMVTRPEVTKDLDQVLESLKPEIEQQRQAMIDTTVRLYAISYTEAELKELSAFFKTPTGQKYLKITPQILDVLEVEIRRWAERVSELVMSRVRAEMGKRGHQL